MTCERKAKSPDPDATAVLLGDLSQAPGACQSLAFSTGKRGPRCPLNTRLNTRDRGQKNGECLPSLPFPLLPHTPWLLNVLPPQ